MWRLASTSEALEDNSEYAYHLFAHFFADTSLIAEQGDRAVGFVTGFRPPQSPESLFVWQIGVDRECRGQGIASRMLRELMDRATERGVRYLEATVTPSNDASERTFHSFQEREQVECAEAPLIPDWLFGSGDHETEMRFRIGPVRKPPVIRTDPLPWKRAASSG